MIEQWSAIALNTAPDSANEIHTDRMARQFGFRGGLVPGVTVSAYLIDPAIRHWGMAWLTRGEAHVSVVSPLYDGEPFEVRTTNRNESGARESWQGTLTRPDGTVSAMAEISLPDQPTNPPSRRGDPVAEPDYAAPAATKDVWRSLQSDGCQAFRYRWDDPMPTYLRDNAELPSLLDPGQHGWANMSFLLGCANWVLAGNAYMNPWVHLETTSRNYAPVARGTDLIAEMKVLDTFEKKGHEFVDVEVVLYDEANDMCMMTIWQRAIYHLRGAP